MAKQGKTGSTRKNSVILFVLRIIKTAVQIVILSLSAKFFGISVERDVYILAYSALLVADIMIWGPVNETFRTKFIHIREQEGEETSIKKTNSLFIFTNVVTLLVLALFYFLAGDIAKLISPGADGQRLVLLTFMIQILSPSILFNQVNSLMTSILNAYNIFFVPEIAGFVSALVNVLCLYLLAPVIGIYSLVVSYYINLLFLFVLLIVVLKRQEISLLKFPLTFKMSHVKVFLLFALPYFVPYFFGQFNTVIEKAIASVIGTGTVSIIDYSRKIVDVPSGVLTGVLATILVPTLSKEFIQKNEKEFNREFINIFQLGIFFFSLFVGFVALSSKDITDFLFNKGSIDTKGLSTIALLTLAYSVAAVAIFAYQIYSFVLLSSGKVKFTAFWGIMPQVLMVGANYFLFRYIGVWIFPLSLFTAHLITVFIYKTQYPFALKGGKKMIKYLSFLIILTLLCRGLYWLYFSALPFSSIINLLIEILIFSVIVLLGMYIFKLEELAYINNFAGKIKDKFKNDR